MPSHALLRPLADALPRAGERVRIAGLIGLAAALLLLAAPANGVAAPLVGTDQIQSLVDDNPAGTAQAFRYSAQSAGTVDELGVYVDSTSTAKSVQVGLYSSSRDRPSKRLTSCTVSAPKTGWNTCSAADASVTSGTVYWLAVLAPSSSGGRVAFRDRPYDGAVSYGSSSSTLSSLPGKYPVGPEWNGHSPASLYGAKAAVADTTPPSAPSELLRTAATETSVSLAWTAATDNVGVSGYRVYRDGVLAGATAGTTMTVSGLACGTSYTFAVEAYDTTGNSSAVTSLTTSTAPCPDTQAPSVPTGMAWEGTTQTSVSVRWHASTDNVGVAGYHLYRDDRRVASTQSLSYTFSDLSCGTSYTFAIEAYDAAGNVSDRADASGTTSTDACSPPADTTAPSSPTNLAKTAATETSVSLRWDASTDDVGVTGYRVFRDGVLAGTTADTTYTVSGLACGTSYVLAAEAYDAAANTSTRGTLTTSTAACPATVPVIDTVPPSVPQGMAWAGKTQTSVSVRWDASTDNVGVAGYHLYRDGQRAASTQNLSYTFSGLACGTSYTFALEAYDAAGNVSNRAEATGTTSTEACSEPAPAPEPTPTPAPEPSPSPGGGTAANLWVDVNGGSCTRSSTQVAYSDPAACGSIDAANDLCQAGDLVLIKGGNYAGGTQNISGSNGRSSMCRIDVASGERALMKRLALSSVKWLTLRGLESLEMDCSNGGFSCSDNTFVPNNKRGLYVSGGSEDVVIENIKYGGFGIFDSRRVTIRGSDFGPCDSYDGQDPGAGGQEGCPNGPIHYCATNIGCTGYNEGHLIERNTIHDFGCDDSFFNGVGSDDCHWECMYVSYASNLTVRGNVFRNCANGGNIFHTFSNGGGSFTAHFGFRNYTVENNVFEQSCNNRSWPCGGRLDTASGIGHCNIYGGTDLTNVKIRFNTFVGGSTFALDTACTQAAGDGLQVVGNLMKRTSVTCGVGWTPEYVVHNIYSGVGICGTSAFNVGATLENVVVSDTNGGDAHLRGSSGSVPADGYVPTTVRGGCPATDIDGQPRPTTGYCDAGADER